ncbi:unnamed protein product [Caenorhabditis bovis]|uniref:Transthyretin-like family protein n=1 Tax=Caenorhabditis bovis TaxID=2654633 RepID=A0A8S1EBM2_9PELO|nr:unnamed protein product [Caenorhabditis bovis]
MQLLLFSILVVSYCEATLGIGRLQSIAVRGRLTCNGVPASNVKIKLYEKENIIDVLMDEVRTDSNGMFLASGSKTELTNIDPKVNVYHRCNYVGICYRKFGITIPDSFISLGAIPKKVYDIGEINLANKFTGETTDCIN